MSKYLNKFYNFVAKIGKHNVILIVFIIFVVIVTSLYQTFSLYTESLGLSTLNGLKTYKFILGDSNEVNTVTIAAESSKNIAVTVSNESDIELLYELYYSSFDDLTDVSIGYLSTSKYLPTGSITSDTDYLVTIKIRNLSDSSVDITLGVKYGLITGGELILDENQHKFEIYPEEANRPDLYDNTLTPVYYDELDFTWKVADSTNPNNIWYDYENQKWANAVLLNNGITKDIGDSIIVEGDLAEIKAMFVWIPRYEYKIEGLFGTHEDLTTSTALQPGEIKVNFINKDKTTPSEGYTIHPAFTFGKVIEEGIWVSKFEVTGSTNEPTSLPNQESIKNENITKYFEIAQTFNSYVNNTDIDFHMTKNSEWGAIAYLSQSKYGKYGNNLYTDLNKEIYQNKSDVTGNSNGTPSQEQKNTQCKYDDITDRGNGTGSCGGGASTTGNIYGVYDTSGNGSEYVMANYDYEQANSAFITMPEEKYYDLYLGYNHESACNNQICYGHALSETNEWYNDEIGLTNLESWLHRGGSATDGANAGIFYHNRADGSGNSNYSFRIIITKNT